MQQNWTELVNQAISRGCDNAGEFILALAFEGKRPGAKAMAEIMQTYGQYRREEEAAERMETMSLDDYKAQYQGKKARVKGQPRLKGVSTDKAFMFANAWHMFAPVGAPKLKPEYEFAPGKNYRSDFRVGRFRLLVEVEGATKRANGGRHNTDQDRFKTNLAAALGWRVFRFSTEALRDDPAGCVDLVLQAIKMRRAS